MAESETSMEIGKYFIAIIDFNLSFLILGFSFYIPFL
jgi:hypothetical protein